MLTKVSTSLQNDSSLKMRADTRKKTPPFFALVFCFFLAVCRFSFGERCARRCESWASACGATSCPGSSQERLCLPSSR